MRAAGLSHSVAIVTPALEDAAPMVRLEAVRGLARLTGDDACAWTLAAAADADVHVALQAINQLKACGGSDRAVTRLADLAADTAAMNAPRGWHQPSHALVALAAAAPDRTASVLPAHAAARNHFVRVYAARAAAMAKDRSTLLTLAADANDNVAEAAIEGLTTVVGADAVTSYVAALSRQGYQAIRVAAMALASCPACSGQPAVVSALRAAHERLTVEGHDNSTDARTAIATALTALGSAPADVTEPPPAAGRGVRPGRTTTVVARHTVDPTLDELRRLAAPRARLTDPRRRRDRRGAHHRRSAAHRRPLRAAGGARLLQRPDHPPRRAELRRCRAAARTPTSTSAHPDYMRDEVGSWPHVRGALGISTRGRDTGDAQFFIDLVDNPRLDHEYTVFGQVITGIEVAERVLEGDVIESIRILAN